MQQLKTSSLGQLGLAPPEPLWKRVPTRDAEGKLLGDFMMLIPGLNKLTAVHLRQVIMQLEQAFGLYQEFVVFADLNAEKNVLWVSHRQRPGIGLELAAVIHEIIPAAKLVAHRYE
ncbi:MAG: hypothetical protein OEZ39_07240 [Gammaproteobacteria bacterium]|nr:hypothetical protein [Gammaproteobacteria bacterium]MDH5651652.1 hypothetical protein [Gammaproteobacteria bacterium]